MDWTPSFNAASEDGVEPNFPAFGLRAGGSSADQGRDSPSFGTSRERGGWDVRVESLSVSDNRNLSDRVEWVCSDDSDLSFGSRAPSQVSMCEDPSRPSTSRGVISSPHLCSPVPNRLIVATPRFPDKSPAHSNWGSAHGSHQRLLSQMSGGCDSSPRARRRQPSRELPKPVVFSSEKERQWHEKYYGGCWVSFRRVISAQLKEEENHHHQPAVYYERIDIPHYHHPDYPGRFDRLREHESIDALVGYWILNYEIREIIGSGSSAVVYKAMQYKPNSREEMGEVALKIPKKAADLRRFGLNAGGDFEEQIRYEAIILNKLHTIEGAHRAHLPSVKDLFHWRGHLVLVLEKLDQNLWEVIRRDPVTPVRWSPRDAIELARQMFGVLKELHGLGLMHCDMKPENIMMKPNEPDQYALIDFGIAMHKHEIMDSSDWCYVQTRIYRAPELLLDLPFDEKIDVWALGIILIELYMGQALFEWRGRPILEQVVDYFGPFPHYMTHVSSSDHLSGIPADPTNPIPFDALLGTLPEDFADILRTMLELDPSQRGSAVEVLQRIEAIGRSHGVTTPSFERKRSRRRKSRRKPLSDSELPLFSDNAMPN